MKSLAEVTMILTLLVSLIGCGKTPSVQNNSSRVYTEKQTISCDPISVKGYYPKELDKPDFSSQESIIASYQTILDVYKVNSNRLIGLIEKVKKQNQCLRNYK